MAQNYHEEQIESIIIQLRRQLETLPPFLDLFFRAIAGTKSPRTRLWYAGDFKIFFTFLAEECPAFLGLDLRDFTPEHLAQVTDTDIERFMAYLEVYKTNVNGEEKTHRNKPRSRARKLAAVRTLFTYYYKKKLIPANPASLVDFPKINKTAIVYLEVDEVARLLDEVEGGESLSGRAQAYHEATKERDLALVTLLLGTGMRRSECIGIDITDLDFNRNAVKVTRKGGDEAILYFSHEVARALSDYLAVREKMTPREGHENALFLSMQRRRMTTKTLENLVKKYAGLVTTMKNITPHKLRSTFGTTLYNETHDIYLVAEVLGHADINTTKKSYAHMSEERRRMAANIVKLRED